MKPAPFAYQRPTTLADLWPQLAAGARPAAGTQSLGPMLNLRLAQPESLADLRHLPELRGVSTTPHGSIRIGAATTHALIEDGIVPGRLGAILAGVARGIAYRAVRNRGTLGGSLAHADPAADWIAVLPALGATLVIQGGNGQRRVPAAEFMTGVFETVLAEGEILLAIELPPLPEAARWGHWKFCRKTGEFSKATACVLALPDAPPVGVLAALDTAPAMFDAAELLADPGPTAAAMVGALDLPPWRAALARTALLRAAAMAAA